MISNLLVLNSSFNGSRDLYWVDDPDPKVMGYNIYRAYNYPAEWTLLNADPHPGNLYRDETVLTPTVYTVKPKDWVSFGIDGRYIFKIPDILWSSAVKGRATVSNHPDDITMIVNGVILRPGRVDGQEGLVYLSQIDTLSADGGTTTHSYNSLLNSTPAEADVVVTYKKLTNYVDIFMTTLRTFYTVVPVKEGGQEVHLPGLVGTPVTNSLEVEQIDYMQLEMVRRNQWVFEQCGEPAYLMIRKSKGKICGCVISNGEPRTGCPSCYETGIIGGYYGPLDILFIDPDTAAVRTLDEGGVKVERTSRSYLTRTPVVHNGDMIVRRNGERMVIANVTYKSPKGTLLQQDFDVELLQPKDTRYLIPLSSNPPVVLVDPRFQATDPTKEPLTSPTTDPTNTWENPVKPEGRTVVFGNIMT
jgi:hypothetical protein